MSFVDYIDDDGGPVLVMEYMPLGNLTELNEGQKISLEEMRTILCQALQALKYLHDQKKITHRDIKPENILVRSRTPYLLVKLGDFGLSTEKDWLKTTCGTRLYAAAGIFTRRYTNAVDIWALGVVGYQFIIGLPEYTKSMDAQTWPKKICREIGNLDPLQQTPVVQLLKRMLKLRSRDRPSAKACLSDPWIWSALPISQPGLERTEVRAGSLRPVSEQSTEIWDPLNQTEEEVLDATARMGSRKRLRSSQPITSCGYLFREVSESVDADLRYERLIRRRLEAFLKKPGCEVHNSSARVHFEANSLRAPAHRKGMNQDHDPLVEITSHSEFISVHARPDADLEPQLQQASLDRCASDSPRFEEGPDLHVQSMDAGDEWWEPLRPNLALPRETRACQQIEPGEAWSRLPILKSSSGSSSDISDLKDDTAQAEDPSEAYTISVIVASKSSMSSCATSMTRQKKLTSIRLESEASLRLSGNEATSFMLRRSYQPARTSCYSAWDSQPQYSQLTEVKPDLKPPSEKEVLSFETFTDLGSTEDVVAVLQLQGND